MPTNKTHTERIVNLESAMQDIIPLARRMKEMEDEQSNHDVSIEDLHVRIEDIERKFPDLKEIKTHIDSLYQGLLDVDTRVTKQKEIIDNIIEKHVQMAFYQDELNRRLVHVERLFGEFHKYVREHPTKKNTKNIPNIVKVAVGILFTTFN